MAILQDIPVNDFIEALANELKNIKDISPPEWAAYVKTGMHKERPPARDDWWHVRAAAVLKTVDKLGPIGVSKLRTKYGGKKNRGHKPERFYRGSGNILRKVLQQLEKAGLVKKEEKEVHRGRIMTPAGRKLLKNAFEEARRSYSKKQKEIQKAEVKPQEKQAPKPEEKTAEKPEAKPEAKKEPEKVPTAHELAEKKKNG